MSKIEEVNIRLEQLKERCRQQGFEEGREQGFEEGRLHGLEQGQRSALLSVLEARFAPIPQWVRDRIQHATTEQLDAWIRRAATAASLERVFEND